MPLREYFQVLNEILLDTNSKSAILHKSRTPDFPVNTFHILIRLKAHWNLLTNIRIS